MEPRNRRRRCHPRHGTNSLLATAASLLLLLILLFQCTHTFAQQQQRHDNNYREFPLRTAEEAAVIEWGHSAIISALDVSVAHFGPQTVDAAVFEVETKPVLASPINGFMTGSSDATESTTTTIPPIAPLHNANEVLGNVVVMTNAGHYLTGIQMARIAQLSGAAALLVVNVDEEHPDEIYRLPMDDADDSSIDIPVVMMSYNSASVLTTATVTPEMKPDEIVNHGMPERIRLYAGGDRPFFEDVVTHDPEVYLIHNMLTPAECETLVQRAAPRMEAVEPSNTPDPLQWLPDPSPYQNAARVMLWQGLWQSVAAKAIEERIEHATGFAAEHLTDFIVDRIDTGTAWRPFSDPLEAEDDNVPYPMAALTIFLTQPDDDEDARGGELIYPNVAGGGPVKIRPQLGLAVIHLNVNEQHEFVAPLHGLLEYNTGRRQKPMYVARKYVLNRPVSKARRIALPAMAAPFGGKLPRPFSLLYNALVERLGPASGSFWFDKLCVFVPMLCLLGLVQWGVETVQRKLRAPAGKPKPATIQEPSTKTTKKRSKRKKND